MGEKRVTGSLNLEFPPAQLDMDNLGELMVEASLQ
jgi:hypothetical protein